MPLLRQPMPVFTLHRGTMLNAALTPSARLLYATLIASLDQDHMDIDACLALAGLKDIEQARPYLDELANAGLVDSQPHLGEEMTLRVNGIPAQQSTRTHECMGCKLCGKCACFAYRDLCEACYRAESVRREAQADIARWKQQLEAGATYAYGRGGARLHRWDCSTLNNVERSLEQMEESLKSPHGGYWPRLPDLFTAAELRMKRTVRKRCATCGPDPL